MSPGFGHLLNRGQCASISLDSEIVIYITLRGQLGGAQQEAEDYVGSLKQTFIISKTTCYIDIQQYRFKKAEPVAAACAMPRQEVLALNLEKHG